jgi:pimeloyl-ACP methyl ester carboxylesterase
MPGRFRVRTGDGWLVGTESGSGDAVVLLHGLASTHRWWDLVAPRLPGLRVIRFDQRGHGGSAAPPGGYDLDHLAVDTLAVLDALDVGRAVLAGHSLGAGVALRVAAARPARVTALACVDGGVYDHRLLFGADWSQARTAMVRPRRGRVTAAVLRAWLTGTDLPAAALPAVLANYTGAGADGATGAATGRATGGTTGGTTGGGTGGATGGALRLRLDQRHEEELAHDLWRQDPVPLLHAVRAPVLVLAARQGDPRQDVPRHESIERAGAVLGSLLTVRWLNGGHELPLHRPGQVAGALRALAARTPDLA